MNDLLFPIISSLLLAASVIWAFKLFHEGKIREGIMVLFLAVLPIALTLWKMMLLVGRVLPLKS